MLILDRIVDQPGLLMVDVSFSLFKMFFWLDFAVVYSFWGLQSHVLRGEKWFLFRNIDEPPQKKEQNKTQWTAERYQTVGYYFMMIHWDPEVS